MHRRVQDERVTGTGRFRDVPFPHTTLGYTPTLRVSACFPVDSNFIYFVHFEVTQKTFIVSNLLQQTCRGVLITQHVTVCEVTSDVLQCFLHRSLFYF
jgi:hypothetical protein